MNVGVERPLADFIAGFSEEWQTTFREDILVGRKRRVVAKEPGEDWALYEFDPERGIARVIETG